MRPARKGASCRYHRPKPAPSPLPKGRGLGRGVRLLFFGGTAKMRPRQPGASCHYHHHDRNAAFTRQNQRTREDRTSRHVPPILPRKRSVPVFGNFLQFGGTDEMRPRLRPKEISL